MQQKLITWYSDFCVWMNAPEKNWRPPLVIFIAVFITSFAGAAQTGLFDRDEPRYAQATREMIQSGNWLVPSFNGEPRLHKPVLIYWLMAASYKAFGDSPLASRLPSMLASAGSCALIYILANRWWNRRTAYWSCLVWATAPLTVVETRMATTDAVLNFCTMAMMLTLTCLFQGPNLWLARLFWLLAGLSVLIKGPVALLIVAPALIITWLFTGVRIPRKWLRPVEGSLIMLAVVLPWLIAVTYKTNGDFLRFAVGRELIGRTVRPAEGHWGIPGYYLAMLAVMFLPWIFFLPGSVKSAWAQRKTDPRMAFLIGWAFGPLVFLELFATKLAHYHYPSYAALAIITANELIKLEKTRLKPNLLPRGRFFRLAVTSFFGLIALCAFGLTFVMPWLALPACLGLAGASSYAVYRLMPAIESGQWGQMLRITTVGWVLTITIILTWILPVGDRTRFSPQLSKALARQADRLNASVTLGEFREPSLIFNLRPDTPVPIVRNMKKVVTLVDQSGAIIIPLSPTELEKVSKINSLDLQHVEQVEALDWNSGKRRSLSICLLTRRPEDRLASLPGLHIKPMKTSQTETNQRTIKR